MKTKIKHVIKFEFIRLVKTKAFLVGLLLAPIFMGVIMAVSMYLAQQSADPTKEDITIGIQSPVADSSFADVVTSMRAMGWKTEENSSAADLRQMVLEGKIKGYIEFDSTKGFGYYSDNLANLTITNTINGFVQAISRRKDIQQLGLDDSQVAKILNPESLHTYKISVDNPETAESSNATAEFGVKAICGSVFFMLFFMCILMFSINVGRSVLEDKSTKIADVLLTSVKPEELLAGKIIGICAAGLLQICVWLLMGLGTLSFVDLPEFASVYNIITPSFIIISLVYFIFGFAAATSIYAAVGSMSETDQHFNQLIGYVQWIIVLPACFLGVMIQNMESTFAQVLSMIPIVSSEIMPFRLIFGGVSTWEIVVSLAILIISCFLIIKAAAKIFRNGIMHQGKEFGFKDVAALLKAKN